VAVGVGEGVEVAVDGTVLGVPLGLVEVADGDGERDDVDGVGVGVETGLADVVGAGDGVGVGAAVVGVDRAGVVYVGTGSGRMRK
jgi:hypothetical protein